MLDATHIGRIDSTLTSLRLTHTLRSSACPIHRDEACPIRFVDSLARKVGAVEGVVADVLERGGIGEIDPRELGVIKGRGADRGDGGPHLEGAGELGAL